MRLRRGGVRRGHSPPPTRAGESPTPGRSGAATWRAVVAALAQAALVLLALGASWWGLGQVWPQLVALDRPPDSGWLLAAGGAYSAALALAVAGWRWLLQGFGVRRPWLEDAWLYTLSLAARRLPGGIWGAVGRVYLYRQAGAPTGAVAVATVAEHGLVVAAALALAPPALALLPLRTSGGAWAALALATVVALAVAQPQAWAWLLRWLARRGLLPADALASPVARRRWLGAGGLFALVWLAGGLALVAVSRAFGALEADPTLVVAAWIVARGAALPLAMLPAGLGLSDLALALLLGYAMPAPMAVASAVAIRALVTLGEVGWALALLTTSQAVHMMNAVGRPVAHDDGPETQRGEEGA
ncbi:MAG: flippase-like domain-containing protein [Chloroflexi bacterium]|nr:flippase-like domain-containing protein [Chloroflexota bacterium]